MLDGCSERLALGAMGTRFELVIAGASSPRACWRSIGEACLEIIGEWHDRLNAFDRGSLVSHVNRCAGERGVRVDSELMGLLAACRGLWRATGGAFDPAMGGVTRRGGVAGGSAGMRGVELDEGAGTVRFTGEGVELDLGGVAKGHVLDVCAVALREMGVTSALLHGGTSSVVGIGRPDGASSWGVGVEIGGGERFRVGLEDRAMSVSAGRDDGSGGREAHVVDPRGGETAVRDGSVCVVGASALECDAWSTALLVLGDRPEGMPRRLGSVLWGGRVEGDPAWCVEACAEELVR